MRGNREEKQALDRQTAYLTFLPPMDEGFHTGYHTAPGIVSDHNQRPREWLESLARYLQTPGIDVSYSIPDVLSAEQQLRRLSRLTPERALAHPSMAAWRAVLALLLLWDTWPQDGAWPALELVRLSDGGTAFSASVTAALSPARAPDGLWAFTLRGEGIPARPVALLSRAMAVVPAADPGDLSPLLSPCVTWYDRAACAVVPPERAALAAQPPLRPRGGPVRRAAPVSYGHLPRARRVARSAFAGRRAGAGRSPRPDSGRPYAG